MTPAEIGQQQVWAAWVSAGAAVAQALGVGLTIFWTVKLARDSDRRERAAAAAALAREEAADAAATARAERAEQTFLARAEAAEREAEQKAQDAERDAYNRPINHVLQVAFRAAQDLADQAKQYAESESRSMIAGGFDSEALQDLRRAIERVMPTVTDARVTLGLEDLLRAAQRRPSPGAVPPAAFAEHLRSHWERLTDSMEMLERMLRH